ncbi:MAG: trigger factor [Bacteroidota bacterium]
MEILTEEIGKQMKSIKVIITPEDYKATVEKGMKERQRNMVVDGFRKGHAPMGLIRKNYGKYVLYDVLDKLVKDSMENYVKEEKLTLIGNFIPTKENYDLGDDWSLDKSLEFDYEIAIAPEVSLDVSYDEVVPVYTVDITEAMVDDEVKKLQRRYSNYAKPDEVGEMDYTFGELIQVDGKGKEIEGGIKSRGLLSLEVFSDDKEKAKFIGKKKDEEVVFDIKKAIKNETDIAHTLNIKKEEVADMSGKFKYVINEITRIELPEVDQALFDRVYGEGKLEGMEAFRENIKQNIQYTYEQYTRSQMAHDLKEYMIQKLNPSLPDEFIRKYFTYKDEKGEEAEMQISEEDYEKLTKSFKWEYIERALDARYNFDIKDEEFMQMGVYLLSQTLDNQNMPSDDNSLREHWPNFIKEKRNVEQIQSRIMEMKTVDAMGQLVKTEEQKVPADLFFSKMTYLETMRKNKHNH